MSAFDEQVQINMKEKSERTLDDVFEFIRSVYDFCIPEGKEAGEHAFNVMDYYNMEELGAFLKQHAAELAAQAEAISAVRGLLEYRRRNTLNFQLEKADDFLRIIATALEQ